MAKPVTDDDDTPPGDEPAEIYQATGPKRGGGGVQFLWFVTADKSRDQIFPIADIRRMEPPDKPAEVAYIHFSGITVVLSGTNLRRVLHRIAMHRCVSVHEWRPDQKRPAKGEPVIERIDFVDLTKGVPKAN
jgi:hypothetical protein